MVLRLLVLFKNIDLKIDFSLELEKQDYKTYKEFLLYKLYLFSNIRRLLSVYNLFLS